MRILTQADFARRFDGALGRTRAFRRRAGQRTFFALDPLDAAQRYIPRGWRRNWWGLPWLGPARPPTSYGPHNDKEFAVGVVRAGRFTAQSVHHLLPE